MDLDGGAALGGLGCVLLVVLLVMGVIIVPTALSGISDARTEAKHAEAEVARARAEEVYARAAVVEANAARDRESNLHREYMFQSYNVALAHYSSDLACAIPLAAFGGVLCAVLVIWFLWRRTAL